MIPYIIFGLYLLFLIYNYDIKNKKSHKDTHVNICLLYLIILVGLRYQFGPDSFSYEKEFNSLYSPLGSSSIYTEQMGRFYPPGWVYLNVICQTWGGYLLVQIICSIIFNANVFFFLRNTANKLFTVLFVFFIYDYLYFATDILRESLAISFDLAAIVFLYRRQKLKMLLFLFLGFCFHYYSIFFIVVVILLNIRIPLKWLTIISIGLSGLISLKPDATGYISAFLFLGDPSGYADALDNKISFLGFAFKCIIPIALLAIRYYNKHYCHNSPLILCSKDNSIIDKLIILYCAVVILRYSIPIADRVMNYFEVIYDVLLVEGIYMALLRNKPYNVRFARLIIILLVTYLPFFYINAFPGGEYSTPMYTRYYPYNSVFEKKIIPERERFYQDDGR